MSERLSCRHRDNEWVEMEALVRDLKAQLADADQQIDLFKEREKVRDRNYEEEIARLRQLTAATQREGALREALLRIGTLVKSGLLNPYVVGKIVDDALLNVATPRTPPPGRESV